MFAEAEHNPVPSDVQKSRGRLNETGAITAPDSVVNTTNAASIHRISKSQQYPLYNNNKCIMK